MATFKSSPIRFQMSYKQKEAPIYIPMEEKMMDEMGLTRCDLHKKAIKHLHNSRVQQQLAVV